MKTMNKNEVDSKEYKQFDEMYAEEMEWEEKGLEPNDLSINQTQPEFLHTASPNIEHTRPSRE